VKESEESSFYWPASLLSFSPLALSLLERGHFKVRERENRNCKGALRRCPPHNAEREREKRVEKEILIVYKRFPRLEFLPECTLS
jgi:hypothetical protein